MTLILPHDTPAALGFDLAAAVSSFADQLEAHRFTVDVPAPTAHPLVEMIVKRHGGQFEIAPVPAPPVEPEPEPQATPSITFAQLLIALVISSYITKVEALAWLNNELPAPVIAAIAELPESHRFAATVRALRPSMIDPNDPLVDMLVAAQNITPEQKRDFFVAAAQL